MITGKHLVYQDFSCVDWLKCVNTALLLNIVVCDVCKCSALGKSSIKKEHRDIDILEYVAYLLLVLSDRAKLSEVENNREGLDFVFFLNFLQLFINLSLGPSNNANVESLGSHLVTDFQTDSVTAPSYYGPRVLLTVSLVHVISTTQEMPVKRAHKTKSAS